MNRRIVIQIAVGIDQVEPQLRGIKDALGRPFRHCRQSRQIIADRISVTPLNFCQIAADRMQAIVVGIKLLGAREVSARLIQIAYAQLRLRGRQLHID